MQAVNTDLYIHWYNQAWRQKHHYSLQAHSVYGIKICWVGPGMSSPMTPSSAGGTGRAGNNLRPSHTEHAVETQNKCPSNHLTNLFHNQIKTPMNKIDERIGISYKKFSDNFQFLRWPWNDQRVQFPGRYSRIGHFQGSNAWRDVNKELAGVTVSRWIRVLCWWWRGWWQHVVRSRAAWPPSLTLLGKPWSYLL